MLPHAAQLFIPQPIISSSCLFNLRVAPCISEQVVYLHSPPHMQGIFILYIYHQSPLKQHHKGPLTPFDLSMSMRLTKKWRKKRMTNKDEETCSIFSCWHVILWKILLQRHWDFPAFPQTNVLSVYSSHGKGTHKWAQGGHTNEWGMCETEHVWSVKNEVVRSLVSWASLMRLRGKMRRKSILPLTL